MKDLLRLVVPALAGVLLIAFLNPFGVMERPLLLLFPIVAYAAGFASLRVAEELNVKGTLAAYFGSVVVAMFVAGSAQQLQYGFEGPAMSLAFMFVLPALFQMLRER